MSLFIVIIAVNDSQNKHCLHLSFFLKLMFPEKIAEFKRKTSIFFRILWPFQKTTSTLTKPLRKEYIRLWWWSRNAPSNTITHWMKSKKYGGDEASATASATGAAAVAAAAAAATG